MRLKLVFFDKEEILMGFYVNIYNIFKGKDPDGTIVLTNYMDIKLGFLFGCLTLTLRR